MDNLLRAGILIADIILVIAWILWLIDNYKTNKRQLEVIDNQIRLLTHYRAILELAIETIEKLKGEKNERSPK